jgi:hypothetical protein
MRGLGWWIKIVGDLIIGGPLDLREALIPCQFMNPPQKRIVDNVF